MKALSVWQPWATLVVIGAKKIETRSWRTHFRGWLAIHASKKFTRDQKALCFRHPFASRLAECNVDELPTSAIIGLVRVADCFKFPFDYHPGEPEASFGDFRFGRFGWRLEDAIKLATPIPIDRGSRSLWDWAAPPEVMAIMEERG